MNWKLTSQGRFALFGAAILVGVSVLMGAATKKVATEPAAPKPSPADVASAKSLSNAFRGVANQVLPAVVAIENKPKMVQSQAQGMPDLSDRFGGRNPFEGTPFEDFFKGGPQGQGLHNFRPQPNSGPMGIGSGVIIDPSGVILTNNHVVEGGGEVTVRLNDGREFKATSVVTDPKTDLAIVRISGATGLIAAKLADSEQVQVGDWVLALGQPFGLESTVTAGIVSATHRGIGITARESFIQTDAAINPGNSGGPLVNLDGEIVGINTAISSRSGGNNGVGFAVPANLARWVSKQLLADGAVHRAYLGVGIQPVTQELAGQFGVKPREGVVVTQVYPETPAAKMGLKSGDVITQLGETSVDSAQDLQLLVEKSSIGESHPMHIVRSGKKMTLSFLPEAQPEKFGVAMPDAEGSKVEPQKKTVLGMTFDELTPDVAKQLGVDDTAGVVITSVEPNGSAAEAGLKPGMIIRQIDRQDITSFATAESALNDAKAGETVLLLVQSDGGSRFVVVKK